MAVNVSVVKAVWGEIVSKLTVWVGRLEFTLMVAIADSGKLERPPLLLRSALTLTVKDWAPLKDGDS